MKSSKDIAILAVLCAVAHAATGIVFFLDPTRNFVAGSDAYWLVLSQQHGGRQAFLIAFAFVGVVALGLVQPVRLSVDRYSWIGIWFSNLALLGYAITAVSYFRLLGGEAKRALAYTQGDVAVQASIRSFSLVLDPMGWLTFAAVGAFLFWASWRSYHNGRWPRWIAVLGMVMACCYMSVWLGLTFDSPMLVKISVGLGATVLAPVWWMAWGLRCTKDLSVLEKP
jgi:hypothetical protein